MAGLNFTEIMGGLTITDLDSNEWNMHGPGWCLLDPTVFWSWLDVDGDNEVLPGEQGSEPNHWYIKEAEHDLKLAFSWEVDQDGDFHADSGRSPWQGLQHNFDAVRNGLTVPPEFGVDPPYLSAVFVTPLNETRNARVQPRLLRPGACNGIGQRGGHMLATLTLRIMEGRFV